ncbi:MAG TPA: GNAT family protein [Pedococcus sp.]|nr:GNAT family protein [Pedococcus sp.]
MSTVRPGDPPGAVLRPLSRADVPALARLVRANRSFMAGSGPLRTDDYFTDVGQERAVAKSLEAAEAGIMYPMLIEDQAGDLVGTLNLNSIIRGAFQSTSIGYWVSQDRNGEGIATAAVALATQVAFVELGLHRIQAETLVDNHASQRVLLKNGFVQYGVAPDYLKIAGRWQEHALFQLVESDPHG